MRTRELTTITMLKELVREELDVGITEENYENVLRMNEKFIEECL